MGFNKDIKQALKRLNSVIFNALNPNSSKISENEPKWSDVNKRELPQQAFAGNTSENPSEWSYPHHFVLDGDIDEETGRYESGDMYLHVAGLNAAWAAAQGARTGEKASQDIIDH